MRMSIRKASRSRGLLLLAVLTASLAAPMTRATVLPEDRADILYHRYQGGGVTVQGPSVLVRKKIGESVSVAANYYVDMISSASIDVVTTASPYTERREQKSLSVDYLHGKSIYSLGYVDSEESDYTGKTAFASVSQDLFGRSTTVSFGFSRGWDTIGKRGRTGLPPDDGPPQLPRRHLAGAHAKHARQPELRQHHRAGLPAEPLPHDALLGGWRLHRRSGDLSAHAHVERRGGNAEILPPVARRADEAIPLLRRQLGHQRAHRAARDRAAAVEAVGVLGELPLLQAERR